MSGLKPATDLNKAGGRRLVTYVDEAGKARFADGEAPPRVTEFQATPGMRSAMMWSMSSLPSLPVGPKDPTPAVVSQHPDPGGNVFLVLTLPPMSIYADPNFDYGAAATEHMQLSPGIADRMEPDAPGFHTTQTIDYVILLAGELWLVLDDGEERCLHPGDVVVQNGTRHAWQNRGEEPATFAVVLMGAEQRSA